MLSAPGSIQLRDNSPVARNGETPMCLGFFNNDEIIIGYMQTASTCSGCIRSGTYSTYVPSFTLDVNVSLVSVK